MTRPLRIAYLKPVTYKNKPYWRTENGWCRATMIELRFHQQIESLIQETLALKRILLQMKLTPEQQEVVHKTLTEAASSWSHKDELVAAVKNERQKCAEVALHFQGQAWDPHLPAHIAGEILARPTQLDLKLHQCEACGFWPKVTEKQPRLNRVTGRWECERCMKPPLKSNTAGRTKEGLDE